MKFTKSIQQLLSSASPQLKKRLIGIVLVLLFINIAVFFLAIIAAHTYPILLGLALLSYGFGLRHAVDADHIAAIDNITRKLMHEGKKPVAVGFFFSLGHSMIVILISLLIAFSASFVETNLPTFKTTGSLIGTIISCVFLLTVGVINLIVLIQIISTWQKVVKEKKHINHASLNTYLNNRGFLTRILKPFLKVVNNSVSMFPIGILFGLGFDTASEIGLLSISAATGTSGMPFWAIMLLPLSFTAGMTLVDTINGILMLGAYGWAYLNPVRKLYYNINITFISVVTALFIGGAEGLQIISNQTGVHEGIFALVNKIQFSNVGYIIVLTFVLSWAVSFLIYKVNHYDRL